MSTRTLPEIDLSVEGFLKPGSAIYWSHTNRFYVFHNPQEQIEYEQFCFSRQAVNVMLCLFLLKVVLVISVTIVDSLNESPEGYTDLWLYWALAINGLYFVSGLLDLTTYFLQRRVLSKKDSQSSPRDRTIIACLLQMSMVIFLTGCGCRLYSLVETLALDGEVRYLPVGITFGIAFTPFVYCLITRGAKLRVSLCLTLCGVAALLSPIQFLRSWVPTLNIIVIYLLFSVFMILDQKQQSITVFLLHQQLKSKVQEKVQEVDKANLLEMQHMIANVAHDLKTPLCSFFSGIEVMKQGLVDLRSAHAKQSARECGKLYEQLGGCASNMSFTNNFMLMTINRILDYTKASQGVALVPKYDTCHLEDTLRMPLMCVTEMQKHIPVHLIPLPLELQGRMIVTDVQWLQENFLCLLSNAVKYSTTGYVEVKVLAVTPDEHMVMSGEGDGSSRTLKADNSKLKGLSKMTLSTARDERNTASISFSHHSNLSRYPSEAIYSAPLATQYLRIEVWDRGVGLSNSAMALLFAPFKQAQRLAGGTGLGLFSLARRVEALAGVYGVRPRGDGLPGSVFWFQIPYRNGEGGRKDGEGVELSVTFRPYRIPRENSDTSRASAAERTVETEERHSKIDVVPFDDFENLPTVSMKQQRRELDILIVDDALPILKMTSHMLTQHKHRVRTAKNGLEAVQILTGCSDDHNNHHDHDGSATMFDVVVMDLQMPVMDGLEAVRRVREWEGGDERTAVGKLGVGETKGADGSSSPRTTRDNSLVKSKSYRPERGRMLILGNSANSDPEAMASAYSVGVDGFMTKPFSLDTFYKTFHEARRANKKAKSFYDRDESLTS